jgi:hypothetical protein
MRANLAAGLRATGVLGRHVVEIARQRGHALVGLAREDGIDLVAGTGLDGVGAVIDGPLARYGCARRSNQFFAAVTGHLLHAERVAGVAHNVAPRSSARQGAVRLLRRPDGRGGASGFELERTSA